MEWPLDMWEMTVEDMLEFYGKQNVYDAKAMLEMQKALHGVPFLCGPISTIPGTRTFTLIVFAAQL